MSFDRPGYRSPRQLVLANELTIPQVFEWNARENPDVTFFRFHDGKQLNTINYAQAVPAMRRAARYANSRVGNAPKVVAVIANTDTITYCLTSLGLLRAGHVMFLISPRNVPAAVVDMLRKTDCRDIFVSQDAPMQGLAQEVLKELDGLAIHPMPVFEDLFPEGLAKVADSNDTAEDLPKEYDLERVAMIMHSSGSTNHPKPIRWTHKRMLHWTASSWFGEVDLTQAVLSVHSTPMFHAIGVLMYCFAANNGMTLTAFPPSSPPTFPTSENVFDGLVKTGSEYVTTAPAFVELWGRDIEKVAVMKRMKGLIFGGAPLNEEVGDSLAAQGISLFSLYGSTEVGAVAQFFRGNPGKDWAYFALNPQHKMVTVDKGEGKYELVVLSDPDMPQPIVNTEVDGVPAYATSDLLEPHPTRPGLWKFYGRVDDQINLSNGEKTNPGPLEEIIREDPHVYACLMFGQGKFQNGVLIEPKPEYKFDPQDIAKLHEFRNTVWPTIERANDFAPQHSRIFKEMIMVSSPSKPFTYNIKGYPRRPSILKDYHDDIEALYVEVEQSAQSDVPAPSIWDVDSTRTFLRTVVQKVVRRTLTDEADFFRNGCDSLQATWIRNTLLRAVREHSPTAAQRIPMNIVFQAPSISALSDAVLRAVHDSGPAPALTSTAEDLLRIAERYSADLPERPSQLRPRDAVTKGDVVVVTGTTGNFGCDVLEHLLRDDGVARVYAFARSGSNALERQRARFRERGLDDSLLSSSKFQMVEAKLDEADFGIPSELLEEIRNSLTHIMHIAWTVNFSLTLPSFELDLKAVRNLVELALSSPYTEPPVVQLVSSIGIFEHCTIPPPVPEIPIEPSSALGTGYAESKWIAEKVLSNVSELRALPVVVVRLGQVSGDKTGHWNEREWFPALVKSASFTQCLPDADGAVSFIPAYPAARAFIEMRTSPTPILHLVHPRPVSWRALITPIAQELGVSLVPYAEWLVALEKSANEGDVQALRENPALRLIDFFRSRAAFVDGREPLGLVRLATEKAQRVSETLRALPELGEMDARGWVAGWKASGFLNKRVG